MKVGNLIRHLVIDIYGVIQHVHGFGRITVLWTDGTRCDTWHKDIEVISEGR